MKTINLLSLVQAKENLEFRYGVNRWEEIAIELGVSKESVKRINKRFVETNFK